MEKVICKIATLFNATVCMRHPSRKEKILKLRIFPLSTCKKESLPSEVYVTVCCNIDQLLLNLDCCFGVRHHAAAAAVAVAVVAVVGSISSLY